MTDDASKESQILLCSDCFKDEGLRLDSSEHGLEQGGACPQCHSLEGRKLTKKAIENLAWRFFVSGTTIRTEYGGAPVIQWNEAHYGKSNISPSPWLKNDIKLIEEAVRIGFFHYGPRLWMIGEVEPLKALIDTATRPTIIARILNEYPEKIFAKDFSFYRLRVNPKHPANPSEYDSPPSANSGSGRLDASGFSVMYGSQDVDVCIHECHAAVSDELYVATLKPQRDLRLLDLTHVLEEGGTEFESLDMAVHMLFLAGSHSYEICRSIAQHAKDAGFDGVIYPSYFSLIRTGGHPFETAYGLSLRRYLPEREKYADAFTIRNFALFGHPLASGLARVECVNRLILTQVHYQRHFGPVTY
jgi:hypothetical protein